MFKNLRDDSSNQNKTFLIVFQLKSDFSKLE